MRTIEIRFILPSEVDHLAKNVLTSFPSKTPDLILNLMEDDLHSPNFARYLGYFDDDNKLIGSIALLDFKINVRGKIMPMCAAAFVSTGFLNKKEHVARDLFRVLMSLSSKIGIPIGCLHPFNLEFYSKMGYGYCNDTTMYSPKHC